MLVFGLFDSRWGWRVEWTDGQGQLQTRDFVQKGQNPSAAKIEATAFAATLPRQSAA